MSVAATTGAARPAAVGGRVCGRRRGHGGWSWGRGSHARPVARIMSIAGLCHSLIGRRMERMGRREGFCSKGFSSEEEMGNEFKLTG